MDCENPLEASTNVVKGYNSVFKLKENELEFLYIAIAMRLVISITKSSINKIHNKENCYLTISENQAIELIPNSKFIESGPWPATNLFPDR